MLESLWLSEKELKRINKERKFAGEDEFVNPRNAAAGTVRQLDSKVASRRNLQSFVYDIETEEIGKTQMEELEHLQNFGFKVNKEYRLCKSIDEVEDFYKKWVEKERKNRL